MSATIETACRVRFRDDLVDSVHEASHEIEDEDHEDTIWYSKMELADIEEENDFLVDNASMLQKRPNSSETMTWRGLLEEKAIRLPVILSILEVWEEKKDDWEAIRAISEVETLPALEKARRLAEQDWQEAQSIHQEEKEQ